jgi:hypothetical protein
MSIPTNFHWNGTYIYNEGDWKRAGDKILDEIDDLEKQLPIAKRNFLVISVLTVVMFLVFVASLLAVSTLSLNWAFVVSLVVSAISTCGLGLVGMAAGEVTGVFKYTDSIPHKIAMKRRLYNYWVMEDDRLRSLKPSKEVEVSVPVVTNVTNKITDVSSRRITDLDDVNFSAILNGNGDVIATRSPYNRKGYLA